ncbi:MAG: ISNCY family transposase [Vicinamibacterales bacterium]
MPDVAALWPADLRHIDRLLEDEAVLEPIVAALEGRWTHSRRRGRPGTPAEVVLRMLLLKHLYRWSFDTLEQEVRTNLVFRGFARVGDGPVPDAKTILKIARVLGADVIARVHAQIVHLAVTAKVTRGRRLRVDTTVVETPIHYPTDSTLLRDATRVLTRTMQRVGGGIGGAAARVRTRLRSVGRRVLAIAQASRRETDRPQRVRQYCRLMATARAVLRDADTTVRRIAQRLRTAGPAAHGVLHRARHSLDTVRPLLRRVLAQTRQRILDGDTHVPDKVLSIFEPHTEAIRKGKLVKPTEFGQLVTIQEAEGQIISAYEIHAGRPADVTLWEPVLDRHAQIFGRVPHLAAADRGFASAANEQAALDRHIHRVVLPRAGPKSAARRAHERQRWFRRGARWRVGCEGRISVIKRRHGLHRCLYHGPEGMHRWVGLGVIADNLLTIARTIERRTLAAA